MRAILQPTLQLYLYTGEEFADSDDSLKSATLMRRGADGWEFDIVGTGFAGTYRLELDRVPE